MKNLKNILNKVDTLYGQIFKFVSIYLRIYLLFKQYETLEENSYIMSKRKLQKAVHSRKI